jgi:hypothetical protein
MAQARRGEVTILALSIRCGTGGEVAGGAYGRAPVEERDVPRLAARNDNGARMTTGGDMPCEGRDFVSTPTSLAEMLLYKIA